MGFFKQNGVKHYTPQQELVNNIKNILQHKKLVGPKIEVSAVEGSQKKTNPYRMKVHYLDKHIFQAMANLTFFFQAIAKHPELQELYEDDIKDLLGIRRNDPNELEYGFMFVNLISAIMSTTRKYVKKGDRFEPKKDYTLKLTYRLQEMVQLILEENLRELFDNPNSQRAVETDISRVLGWVGMLASGVPDEHDIVRTEKYETSIKYIYETSTKVNRPDRTFEFDTTKLLGDTRTN